jgi:hypothetical protein
LGVGFWSGSMSDECGRSFLIDDWEEQMDQLADWKFREIEELNESVSQQIEKEEMKLNSLKNLGANLEVWMDKKLKDESETEEDVWCKFKDLSNQREKYPSSIQIARDWKEYQKKMIKIIRTQEMKPAKR